MTGILVSGCLLFLAWLVLHGARRARLSATTLILGVCVAPLILLVSLGSAWLSAASEDGRASTPRMGEMRMTLKGLSIPAEGFLAVGGDPERDDFVVRGAAPTILTINDAPAPDDGGERDPGVAATLLFRTPEADQPSSIVSVNGRFAGATPFRVGDALCLRNCEAADARWSLLTDRGGRLRFQPAAPGPDGLIRAIDERAASGAALPQRHAFASGFWRRSDGSPVIALPAPRAWRASQAVHPLRNYLAFPEDEAPDPRLRSVLYQHADRPFLSGGWSGSDWSLLPLDPGLWVARSGDRPAAVAPVWRQAAAQPVPPKAAVSVWDVRYYESVGQDQPMGRLQERRAFSLHPLEGGGLSISLPTPATRIVGRCAGNGRLSLTPDMAYPFLGGRLTYAFDRRLPLPASSECHRFLSADHVQSVGDDGSALRLHMTLERFGAPLPLLLAVPLGWAVVVICLQMAWTPAQKRRRGRSQHAPEPVAIEPDWRDQPLHWAIFCVLQTFLAFRLLIAFSGAAADPDGVAAGEVVREALLAYAAFPALFLLLAVPARRRLWRLGGHGLFMAALLAAIGLLWGERPGGLAMAGAILLFLAIAAVAIIDRLARRAPPAPAASAAPDVTAPEQGWASILTGSAVVRAVLGVLSIKERIPVIGVAVSVFYTPALILGFSGLMARTLKAPAAEGCRRALWFWVSLTITLGLLPILVKDNGYMITALPIAGMAAWGAMTLRKEGAGKLARWMWAAPAIGAAVLLLTLLAAGAISKGDVAKRIDSIAEASQAVDDAQALTILETVAAESNNDVRIMHMFDPEWLQTSGSSEAENIRVVAQHLSDYTASLLGRGYLHDVRLSALAPVHMNDNVSAVHLMAPFGRLSAASLLLALAACALACARMTRPQDPADRTWPELAGLLSLWMLFGINSYIILANLQLVPFTGRNVYLLAAASDSDLMEGVGLFFLAYLGLAWRSTTGPALNAALAWARERRRRLPVEGAA